VSMNQSNADDELAGELREALAARAAVPPEFIAIARSAYAWHHIDAELAQLVYDSRQDAELSGTLRSETAVIRALTFASPHFSIEIEVTDDALLGQLIPPQPGTVEAQARAGEFTSGEIDEVGCFAVEPKPDGEFRLRFRANGQPDVITGWLTLLITG
jgi:hypothetical protein